MICLIFKKNKGTDSLPFYLFLAAVLLLLSSCQKVIELDLATTSAQIVIEGNVYNGEGPFEVKITRSVDFDESNNFPAVKNARVIITDDHGNVDTLVDKRNNGIYYTQSLRGIPGYTYTLRILTEGVNYTAVSAMPEPVAIDSIYSEDTGMDSRTVSIVFQDPPDIDNYYNIIQYKNSVFVESFNAASDRLYKGKEMTFNIRWSGPDDEDQLDKGDHLIIWLESVDKGIYEYFRTAGNSGDQSASPSNPVSNISNGALGYFNACAVTKQEYIVK